MKNLFNIEQKWKRRGKLNLKTSTKANTSNKGLSSVGFHQWSWTKRVRQKKPRNFSQDPFAHSAITWLPIDLYSNREKKPSENLSSIFSATKKREKSSYQREIGDCGVRRAQDLEEIEDSDLDSGLNLKERFIFSSICVIGKRGPKRLLI